MDPSTSSRSTYEPPRDSTSAKLHHMLFNSVKQSLYDFSHINGLNLYGWISILSLLYLFPVALSQWVCGFHRVLAAVPSPRAFYWWLLLSKIFYHLYNQSSYQALDNISPLTFSVGNTMKRVVVIVALVLVFRNLIRPLNEKKTS